MNKDSLGRETICLDVGRKGTEHYFSHLRCLLAFKLAGQVYRAKLVDEELNLRVVRAKLVPDAAGLLPDLVTAVGDHQYHESSDASHPADVQSVDRRDLDALSDILKLLVVPFVVKHLLVAIWIRQLGDDGDTLSFDLVDGDLQVVNFIKFNRVHILFYIGSHLVS